MKLKQQMGLKPHLAAAEKAEAEERIALLIGRLGRKVWSWFDSSIYGREV